MNELSVEIGRMSFKARRAWLRLSEDQQAEVAARFARHVHYCRKAEMDIDHDFLPEVIHDLGKGYEL